MSRFFDTIKSAIFEEVDETPKQNAAPPMHASPEQPVTSQQPTETNVTVAVQTTSSNYSALLDKLCKRLEDENLPGPDYYELRGAVSDPDMVDAIPDITKRFLIAYKSLKAATPSLNKTHITTSIDHYIGCLRKWEKEAIDEVAHNRAANNEKRNEIERLKETLETISNQIATLTAEVKACDDVCNQNEADMKYAIGVLIDKLLGDKKIIVDVLKD